MTKIFTPLIVGYINNANFVSLHEPFGFHSDVLEKAGLKSDIWASSCFVFDFESIPNIIRGPIGENKRGGTAHDILSRKDICPGITKSIAADVYFEIMEYCDKINQEIYKKKHPNIIAVIKTRDWIRRWAKSTVVRYYPSKTFWQKFDVCATAEEIYGIKGDPYICIDENQNVSVVRKNQS